MSKRFQIPGPASKAILLSALLMTLCLPGPGGFCSTGARMSKLATGGPYRANRGRVQRFSGQFTMSSRDLKRPLILTLHNGFNGKPGFTWLRVFLCGDINVKSMGRHEEPVGDLLLDENYVQRHTIKLHLTDLVQEGANTIVIEGKGQRGAVISWVLEGTDDPGLSDLNPTRTNAGARITLSGMNFSPDAKENKVMFNGKPARVISASRSRLTIEVPKTLKSGKADVVIESNGLTSKRYEIIVEPVSKG